MEPEEAGPNLREYLRILKRRRWIMLATLATVVIATALASLRMTPIYEGEAQVEIQPAAPTSISRETQVLQSLLDPQRSLATQVELIKSFEVLKIAAEDLGLPSTSPLKEGLDVRLVGQTEIVEIRVEQERPDEARDWTMAVANAYISFRRQRALDAVLAASEEIGKQIEEVQTKIAEQDRILGDLKGASDDAKRERSALQAQVETLEAELSAPQPSPAPPSRSKLSQMQQLRLRIADLDRRIADYEGGGGGPQAERDRLVSRLVALDSQRASLPDAEALQRGGGTIIAPARIPSEPVRPNMLTNLSLAVALGLALAVGVAFLAESLDDRMRSPEEVEQKVGAPILGHVPYVKEWSGEEAFLVSSKEPSSGAAESYRTLRTNLRFLSLEQPLRTILVTSAMAEEGKSTTAANLAVALAEGGSRTILISCDLRRPSAHKFFGLSDGKGLVDALDPEFPLELALQTNSAKNLRVLSAGGLLPNPTEILASPRFSHLLRRLAEAADVVVIDSPPVLGLADAGVLASKVDGVLLVVDIHETTRRALTHAADQIRKAGGQIIGALMNAVEPQEGYGYYYQYYYYRYGDQSRKPKDKTEQPQQSGR